ncbi:sphingomyelin phosphodiesterase 4 [Drosophila obscura]|uniref:sphingomyelin phosphodiesterase 4 n=1 Tax=Drosophila obscura TaxID=7282 RepID=UPI001BB1F173|nr:sphingomyelin phosphodiesterase 4 [Drosophila obscura]
MMPAVPPENILNRVLAVLRYPPVERVHELLMLMERCSLRELQEIFPHIVHFIFGVNGNPLGWGLRTTTPESGMNVYKTLEQFFSVCGPWMNVCHRLLAEQAKFEMDINLLPVKLVTMLQTGQSPMFYADLLNIDPQTHQVSSLSLNSFDFFMLHFVVHGLQPLHSIDPVAMQIHNTRSKTVYLVLVSDYLNNFLPLFPDARIEPSYFSGGIKAAQPLPTQSLQPLRQPRYIKIPSSYRNGNSSGGGSGGPGGGNISPQSISASVSAARNYAWRSESVLHFFVDIWLRYDVESEHHLPGSDWVRAVRTLVKQIHFFASAAPVDHTSLCSLRKLSLSMVKGRIYAFLSGLIDRWPLDSSLLVVLELWLSYIQPWRYTMATLNSRVSGHSYKPAITSAYDAFIVDNLIVYTHIFMQLLPHFGRLDYTVYRNCQMLSRLAITFGNPDLVDRLQRFERMHSGNSYGFDSPLRQTHLLNKSLPQSAQWSSMPKLFSDTMRLEMENFLFVISMARNQVLREVSRLRMEILEKQRLEGFLKNFLHRMWHEPSQDETLLADVSRVPEVLRQCIDYFCGTFNVDQANLSMHETLPEEFTSPPSISANNRSFFNTSDSMLDTSRLNPRQMWLNASNLTAAIDPALLPIQTGEITYLVRRLHRISDAFNQKYKIQLQSCYERQDFFGSISRQLLLAPMIEQWFDKRDGDTDIWERTVTARVSLRPLASMFLLSVVAWSMFMGFVFLGSALQGIGVLLCLFIGYVLLMALCSP